MEWIAKNPRTIDFTGILVLSLIILYGELLGLEWNDINFSNWMMSVSRTSCYNPERGIYTDTPKTEQSVRTLKLPMEVVDKLKEFKSWQSKYAAELGNKWQNCGRIFTAWDGTPLSPNAPGHFFREYCDWNSLLHVTIHSFRHLNASLLISNGVDIKTVQACLGHSAASTTLNIYAHSFQAQQMRAMESVANTIQMKKTEKAKRGKKSV